MVHTSKIVFALISAILSTNAFVPRSQFALNSLPSTVRLQRLQMSEPEASSEPAPAATAAVEEDVEISPMDAATREMEEKIRRADELRSQEVFIKRSTGKHNCGVCDYTYDETKGDIGTIGGTIQAGTPFSELPSNWRCPTCRASKDNFEEVVEEIPGFAVNQGYGFGGNSMTAGQKNGIIFGGLGLFFLLFLSGYAMS